VDKRRHIFRKKKKNLGPRRIPAEPPDPSPKIRYTLMEVLVAVDTLT
jgi:hypothetical protein